MSSVSVDFSLSLSNITTCHLTSALSQLFYSRLTGVTHAQESGTRNLCKTTCQSFLIVCYAFLLKFLLYNKFLARNITQVYSTQQTCINCIKFLTHKTCTSSPSCTGWVQKVSHEIFVVTWSNID